MKCNDPERGAVYTALLAQHTGLTDEQMREFVSSDPAVPGPHDANVSRIVRKGKLFRADWFAHCNPVDGVVVLPSAAGLEAGEISRAAGKRKRHHVERLYPGQAVWIEEEEEMQRDRREVHVILRVKVPIEARRGGAALASARYNPERDDATAGAELESLALPGSRVADE